jgi:hypothetical protein
MFYIKRLTAIQEQNFLNSYYYSTNIDIYYGTNIYICSKSMNIQPHLNAFPCFCTIFTYKFLRRDK